MAINSTVDVGNPAVRILVSIGKDEKNEVSIRVYLGYINSQNAFQASNLEIIWHPNAKNRDDIYKLSISFSEKDLPNWRTFHDNISSFAEETKGVLNGVFDCNDVTSDHILFLTLPDFKSFFLKVKGTFQLEQSDYERFLFFVNKGYQAILQHYNKNLQESLSSLSATRRQELTGKFDWDRKHTNFNCSGNEVYVTIVARRNQSESVTKCPYISYPAKSEGSLPQGDGCGKGQETIPPVPFSAPQ